MKKYEDINIGDILCGKVTYVCDESMFYVLSSENIEVKFYMNFFHISKKLSIGDETKFVVVNKISGNRKAISVSNNELIENCKILYNIGHKTTGVIVKQNKSGVLVLIYGYQICYIPYSLLTKNSNNYNYDELNILGLNIKVDIKSINYYDGVKISRYDDNRKKYYKIINITKELDSIVYTVEHNFNQYKLSFVYLIRMISENAPKQKQKHLKNKLKEFISNNDNLFDVNEYIPCFLQKDNNKHAFYDIFKDSNKNRTNILNKFLNSIIDEI